jgi:hypothetical protein
VRLYDNGRLNPKPIIKIIHETPSTAVIDGDKGLGLVVAPKAMEIAMEKADKVGSGWISVQNSNHFGIAGYHAMKALHKDMIGWAMTNAAPLVTPTFSKRNYWVQILLLWLFLRLKILHLLLTLQLRQWHMAKWRFYNVKVRLLHLDGYKIKMVIRLTTPML